MIICWTLSFGISSVFIISSMLCQTLSLNRVNSFSSFADKPCVLCYWLLKGFLCDDVVYKVLRTFRLDYWSGFGYVRFFVCACNGCRRVYLEANMFCWVCGFLGWFLGLCCFCYSRLV